MLPPAGQFLFLTQLTSNNPDTGSGSPAYGPRRLDTRAATSAGAGHPARTSPQSRGPPVRLIAEALSIHQHIRLHGQCDHECRCFRSLTVGSTPLPVLSRFILV